jgi:hypothetical protein
MSLETLSLDEIKHDALFLIVGGHKSGCLIIGGEFYKMINNVLDLRTSERLSNF